jgi:subtilisin family serine protease
MKTPRSLSVSMLLALVMLMTGSISISAMPNVLSRSETALPYSFATARPARITQSTPMALGRVLVGLKPDDTASINIMGVQASHPSLSPVFAELGVQDIQPVFPSAKGMSFMASNSTRNEIDLSRIYRLRLAPNADILSAVRALSAQPAVAYAEPDYLAYVIATPNDSLFPSQWALTQINAPAAWDVVTGTTDVAIAVIDSGIDTTHPDLAGQLWVNPGEIPGNGLDDDSNGYVDDVNGWNVLNHNADLSDNTGHGTEVAGVIAAATDNNAGVAGVCWTCRLMIVKVIQPNGVANYSDIAAGIAYAAQKGAKIINLSLGGSSDSITLKSAIAAASQTAVVVGGAGNDNSSAPFYPAAYDDYVLGVAGTTITDTKVGTSNYGTWVDVSAPGEAVTTTFSGGAYGSSTGTSMAAPFVSGLAGLLRSQHPDWSPSLVRSQIIHTTDNIDGLNPAYAGQLGSGRINAGKAVTTTAMPELSIVSYAVDGVTGGSPTPGSVVSLNVALKNNWGMANNASGTLSTSDQYVTISNATASFGQIDAYNTVTNTTDYVFSVSASAPYAHAIPLSLTVSATGGFSAVIPMTITTQSGIVSISGMISSDTIWTNDKVYLVDGNVLVSSGITLTIQPGTVVKFNPSTSLLIGGTLIADGTADQKIIFTAATSDTPGAWGTIKFTASAIDAVIDSGENYLSGSIFRYVRIEYGHGIGLVDALPYFSHVTFYKNWGNNEGVVTGCVDSASALHWTGKTPRFGSLVVRDSVFIENQGQGFATNQPGGGSVHFDVTRNQFLRNTGAAVVICNDVGGAQIASNIIKDNGAGISLGNTGSAVVITDNFISGSTQPAYTAGFGLDIYSGSPTVRHNVFANNGQNPAFCGGSCSVVNIFSGGAPTVISNTFTGNWLAFLVYFNYGGTGLYQYNNWAGNRVNYIFYRSTQSTQDTTATLNYWGTSNSAIIDGLIYDFLDDFNPGQVFYQPVLTSPEPSAPAYLWNTAINPDPVGIQQATFTLTFSAPMDQSLNPVVTFGATQPYTSFAVLDNAQWVTDAVWQATYDFTSLVPRGAYTLSVSGAKGLDGMEIPTDTRFGFTVDYAGQITDQTAPNAPLALASGRSGDPSYVEAQWLANDPDSSITEYRYAIGSAAGATDIVDWTVTTSNGMSRSGLGLVAGRQYWVAVQAQNVGGLWSASAYSAFSAGQGLHKVFLPIVVK